jgi:hypothetical protein
MISATMLLSTALAITPQVPRHYEYLENNNKYVVVKINPAEYKASVFVGKPDTKADIFFNTNYFWGSVPIGLLKYNNKVLDTIEAHNMIRPSLCIDPFGKFHIKKLTYNDISYYPMITQAGPTLIEDGKVKYPTSLYQENFKNDVTRKGRHIAIGILENKKLIIVYGKNATLYNMTDKMKQYNAVDAINFDGGSSTSLYVYGKKLGRKWPLVGIQFYENK